MFVCLLVSVLVNYQCVGQSLVVLVSVIAQCVSSDISVLVSVLVSYQCVTQSLVVLVGVL